MQQPVHRHVDQHPGERRRRRSPFHDEPEEERGQDARRNETLQILHETEDAAIAAQLRGNQAADEHEGQRGHTARGHETTSPGPRVASGAGTRRS